MLREAGLVIGTSDTILGEWTPDGSHSHFGPGPPPKWEAFVTTLVQKFAGNQESGRSRG
jgi:hypothetical protein